MAIDKNKTMEAAQKFVEKGQVDKAIKELQKITSVDAKDVRVLLKLGDLYAKKNAKPEATEIYLKVASLYGEQGFYLKAVAVYKQVLKLDPRLVDVNLKLAEVYRQLGLMSDAMQQYELVAAFYHREGRTKEALATVRELVDSDPENVATRIKLAELYSKEQMTKEAISEFTKVADYLRSQNRTDDFIKVAERLAWHQPDNHQVNRELAALYLRRNDPPRALQKLQTCFKADPRDVETLGLLAQAFLALNQKPKTVSVWKELARIYQESGRETQMVETWRKVLTVAPDDAEALAAIGGRRAVGTGREAAIPFEPPIGRATQAMMAVGRTTGAQPLVPQAIGPSRVATPIEPDPETPPPVNNRSTNLSLNPPPPVVARVATPTSSPAGSGRLAVQQANAFDEDSSVELDPDDLEESSAPQVVEMSADYDDDLSPSEGDISGSSEMILEGSEGSSLDSSEAHAEEIARIFTETDVYIKYSLHQKAIEHLQRVFEMDSRNFEAHEKLKDIFVSVGREPDAMKELVKLAELSGPSSPEQAAAYLRELFAIDPVDARGRQLAHRFRIDVESLGGAPDPSTPPPSFDDLDADAAVSAEVATVDEPAVAPLDFEFDELAPPPPRESTVEVDAKSILDDVDMDGGIDAEGGDDLAFDDRPAGEAAPPAPDHLNLDAVDGELEDGHRPDQTSLDVTADAEFALESNRATPTGDAIGVVDPVDPVDAPASLSEEETAQLEDDLDEADFFISQSLVDDARKILEDLLVRHPGNPLVLAKLAEMGVAPAAGSATHQAPPPAAVAAPSPVATPEPPKKPAKKSTVIAKALGAEDAATHKDLGMAYKEMGLLDEAIKEFSLVRETPGLAVECHLLIGLCQLERGKISEAITEFKTGLYVEGINDSQSSALYFEIGAAYEAISDAKEALYYFEKVAKKDPRFRDVHKRIDGIKSKSNGKGAAKNGTAKHDEGGGHADSDAALDAVFDGTSEKDFL